jgi:hypothetical protein
VAREVALRAGEISERPAGTQIEFQWVPRPSAVALDLAIQAAGLVSVPGSEEKDLKDIRDPRDEKDVPDRPAGGVVVAGRTVSQEELIAAAERIQEAVGPSGDREIVVAGGSPEHWPDRALLSWATVYGAAVLLSDPASRVASAVWARPTVFHGTAAELSALRRAVEQEKPPFWDRKRGRLPFGRLRTVLWIGEKPSPEEWRFWEERGVRLAFFPGSAGILPAS